jgi:hypothetical protein
MRNAASLVLASLVSLVPAAVSHAGSYAGLTVTPGSTRVTGGVTGPDAATIASSFLAVETWGGSWEHPTWLAASPMACTATTANYEIRMDILSPTLTRISVRARSIFCRLRSVSIGSVNTRLVFDLTDPNPGTIGSMSGLDPSAFTLTGTWDMAIEYSDRVQVGSRPIAGDLYCRMTMTFDSPFDGGDSAVFYVDTDAIN